MLLGRSNVTVESKSGRKPALVLGTLAPSLSIGLQGRERVTFVRLGRHPVVLALLGDCASPDTSSPLLTSALAALKKLRAALVVLSASGLWCFSADDDTQLFAAPDRCNGKDVEVLRKAYGCDGVDGSGLFLIDSSELLRFALSPLPPGARSFDGVLEVLSAAGRALRGETEEQRFQDDRLISALSRVRGLHSPPGDTLAVNQAGCP